MNQDWQGALVRRLLLLLAGCLLIGLITGEYAWALALGLGGYLAWTIRQIRRLQQWLKRDQPDDPPPRTAMASGARSSTACISCSDATSICAASCNL